MSAIEGFAALAAAPSAGLEANLRRQFRFLDAHQGDWFELQALDVPNGRGGVTKFAHIDNATDALRLCAEIERSGCMGVFLIGNSIAPAVSTRAARGAWHVIPKGGGTTDKDIIARRFIFLDCDAQRPKGTSASDEEIAHAHAVALRVHGRLAELFGSDAPLGIGDSGNGRAIFIALANLPETPELATLVKGIVNAVSILFSTAEAHVDPTVVDAKRLSPAFGTLKRKGAPGIPERPHRRTGFVCADQVARLGLEDLETLLVALQADMSSEQRTAWDKAMGIRPARAEASRPASPESPFSRANNSDVRRVANFLNLLDDDDYVRCPGCGTVGDSSVAFVGNGLKCLHASCAGKGLSGFRTPVDLVVEAMGQTPREAVETLAGWFGFEGFRPPRERSERGYEDEERAAIQGDGEPPGEVASDGGDRAQKAESASSWPVLDVGGIFSKLEPINYLIEPLDLCPGAPALLAGYGFSGKTGSAQSAGLSIAAGQRVWSTFTARRGRVLHVDYEQGARLTRERYQRLAAAMMVPPQELEGWLFLVSMPQVYLDTPAAESFLREKCTGFDLLIIDSLRAAAPTIEENDSGVRLVLDMLCRVSNATGCCVLVIHHARKPQRDSAGGAKMAIRGSGAIFDACSSVLVFEGEKGAPTRVMHEKARSSGRLVDDFLIKIEDVEIDGNPRGGLAVTAEAVSENPVEQKANQALDGLKGKIVDYLREHGNAPSKNVLRQRLAVNRDRVYAALEELIAAGTVATEGTKLTLGVAPKC